MSNMKYPYFLVLALFIGVAYCCDNTLAKTPTNTRIEAVGLNEIDGPYIYSASDSLTIYAVKKDSDSSYYIQKNSTKKGDKHRFTCHVNNIENDSFSFSLMETYEPPKAIYKSQEKLFVTSDIEGNFNTFYSLLVGNKVMDKDFNWTFGSGHLVIAGDMVDRGNNVMPCLWLLYKLEQDAKKAGGQVHYILGNHDVMNMHGNIKYVKSKYIKLAQIISGKEDKKEAYLHLLSNTNELAKWIASKNAIEKIGNNLYAHGGISIDIIDANLCIEDINSIVRENIRKNLTSNPEEDGYANLVFSNKGPLWYRGLISDYKDAYKKIDSDNLDVILRHFDANRIIIGHTIVDNEVSSDFKGRVIRVDIKHSDKKFTGKSQALFIKGNKYYKVNDNGEQFELEF